MTAVLHDLHWLPVVLRIQYKMIVAVFKVYRSGTPQYLADLIVKHSPVRSLWSSQDHNLLEEPKYTRERLGANRRAKFGKIQGGCRCSQDLTKGGGLQ